MPKFRSLHGSNNENKTKKERKEEKTRLVLSVGRYILIHVFVISDIAPEDICNEPLIFTNGTNPNNQPDMT